MIPGGVERSIVPNRKGAREVRGREGGSEGVRYLLQ